MSSTAPPLPSPSTPSPRVGTLGEPEGDWLSELVEHLADLPGELVRTFSETDFADWAPGEWALLVAGLSLLIFGRRLYWLGVGSLGFVTALYLGQLAPLPSPEARWAIGILAGIAGVVLALTVQKIAIAAAGFVLGCLAVLAVLPWAWPDGGLLHFVVAPIGGAIGLLLARPFFDFVLVLTSSAAGALLITRLFDPSPGREAVAVLVLTVVGLVIQSRDSPADDGDDDD